MSNYKGSNLQEFILWSATITFGTSVIFLLRFIYKVGLAIYQSEALFTDNHRSLFTIAITSFGLFLIFGAINDELNPDETDEN